MKVYTMIVNNSTNIDKTNIFTFHLIPLNIIKTTTHEVGNPGHVLEQVQTYGGVKPVNGISFLFIIYTILYGSVFLFQVYWMSLFVLLMMMDISPIQNILCSFHQMLSTKKR